MAEIDEYIEIPGIIERITRARHGEQRHQAQLEASLAEIIGQGAMVVARGFKPMKTGL